MINHNINHYLKHHELVLERLLAETDIPAERIRTAMLYSLFPGGKRLRPLLVYLCGEVVGLQQGPLDIIAAAIEFIHGYSLIHDDLPAMDDDDLRRGKPSCHKAFDEATAILSGDGLQALAIELLLSHLPQFLTASQVIEVTHQLVLACGPSGMVSGQSLDLSELAKPGLTEEQLRLIHSLKTGKLIAACAKMVLAACSAPVEAAEALINYTSHLGLVFQMQDDYLDRYGKTDLLGKGRASDLANQKTTFASLYRQRDLHRLIEQHFQQAKNALTIFAEKAHDLIELTDYLQKRSDLTSQSLKP